MKGESPAERILFIGVTPDHRAGNEEEEYPEGKFAPGIKWEEIPNDFECPSLRRRQGPVL